MAYRLDPEQTETRIIHALVDFAGQDVLEIGCGNGRLTWRFAEQARSVLALDPKAAEIEQARGQMPAALSRRVTFEAGDITTIELPEHSFDVAVLSWSI